MADNDQQPATKKDLEELEARVDARLTTLEGRMDAQFLTPAQCLERAETTILSGFHSYAQRQEIRTTAL